MKRLLAIVAGGVLAAGLVAQAADPVYSVNAVGYAKLSLPAGFSMISLPFNAVGGNATTIGGVFPYGTVQDSTTIFFYMPGAGYAAYTFVDNGLGDPASGWWGPTDTSSPTGGSNAILRGEGFWIQVPGATNIVLAGEVPGASNGTNTVPLVTGFQMVSFAYPATGSVTNGLAPSDGDTIFSWTGSSWQTYSYVYSPGDPADTGWYDNNNSVFVPDVALKVGAGYWYQSSQSMSWNQTKPYQWP